MPERVASSDGYALSTIVTILGTWYCTHQAKETRPFQTAAQILILSTVCSIAFTLHFARKNPDWHWKDVSYISGGLTTITHLAILFLFLTPQMIKSPAIAFGTCMAAASLAHELCTLQSGRTKQRQAFALQSATRPF